MSAVVHPDYAVSAEADDGSWLQSWPKKRLIIAVAGCVVMALSGTGLANYLDTSGVTGSDTSSMGASQAEAAPLN